MPVPGRARWAFWLVSALLGVLTGSLLFFMVSTGKSQTFLPGAYIAEVPVGGLDVKEAEKALQGYVGNTDMTLLVTGPEGYEKRYQIEAVGGRIVVEDAVKKAMDEEQRLGLMIRIRAALGSSEPRHYALDIKYDPSKLANWLEQLRFDVDRKPKEPRVTWVNETMRVQPAASGRRLDSEALLRSLPKWYEAGDYKISLRMKEIRPLVDESELTGLTELGASYTEFNAGNKNRTSNLKKAAAALNGTVVERGGVFSFNETVGPRDLANGYLEAMVIIKNEFTPGIGGGICQVSSTLYNACLTAGMNIVERHNHSVAVGYVPVGLDATVAYPYRDFKFKNTADSAIYINAFTRGSQLWVKIYGKRAEPIRVKIERYIDKTIPYTTVEKPDPSLAPGTAKVEHQGVPGYKVRTYRVVYDEAGSIKERTLLAVDTYTPLNKLVLVGPKPVSAGNASPHTVPNSEPPVSLSPPASGDEQTPPAGEQDGGEANPVLDEGTGTVQ